DVPDDKVKFYSNPLFEFDDEYISSDVNPLFDEVLEDIECKDSYDLNLDQSTFLVTPLFDSNKDEYFTPGDDIELLLHHDLSIPKMSGASILEGFTDELLLEENDDLFDFESKNDEWMNILYDAQIDDLMSEDKFFDPEICVKKISPTYASLPFTDYLLSSGSEDTIFDSGIFVFHFSHRSGTFISFNVYPNILNESPMKNFPSTCFTHNITMIWGDDIELLLHHDLSIPKMSGASILEGFTDELLLEENDDLFDFESKNDEWMKILYDAQIDDLMSEDKFFDPGICVKKISPTYVSLPFTDYLLSSGSEDTIFDSGIFVFHFSHRFARFGTPRAIISDRGTHFCNDQFSKVMTKYGVTHRLAVAYHP
nr:reverse transcriptase domain-containing protein [Tanacetum cinerariifolium]